MTIRVSVLGLLALAACSTQRKPESQPVAVEDHTTHMPAPGTAGAAVPAAPGLPPSNATAAARLAASPRHGEWVKFPVGQGTTDSVMAWIVYPSARTRAPVVVVVHEIMGLSTWVRSVADQVAAEGFIAIAPDFLSRVRGGPSNEELRSDSATRLIRGVEAPERNRIITAAANYAMVQPSAEQRYAVVGYCWGGQTTFMHAIHGGVKGFSGGVAYYGLPYITAGSPATATSPAMPATVNADSMAKINVPMMLLNGSKDARIGAAMPVLETVMRTQGKEYVGVNYEGAVHGFLRAQDDPRAQRDEAEEAANLAATKDAWPRTIAFLRKNLGIR